MKTRFIYFLALLSIENACICQIFMRHFIEYSFDIF